MRLICSISPAIGHVIITSDQLENEVNSCTAIGWESQIGTEQAKLSCPLVLEGSSDFYLGDFLRSVAVTIRQLLRQAVQDFNSTTNRVMDWIGSQLQQILIIHGHVRFKCQIEDSLRSTENALKCLGDIIDEMLAGLHECSLGFRLGLCTPDRAKLAAWTLHLSHSMDLARKLRDEGIINIQSFLWQSQLRFDWDDEKNDCSVAIFEIESKYEYEYSGNGSRLVITPNTERIFCSAARTISSYLASNFIGPPGCGKTESVKELAYSFGKCLYAFELSLSYDVASIDRVLHGLAACGCWVLLENLERLQTAVLSVMMAQCKSVLQALSAKKSIFNISGEDLILNSKGAFFATYNPGIPDFSRLVYMWVVI